MSAFLAGFIGGAAGAGKEAEQAKLQTQLSMLREHSLMDLRNRYAKEADNKKIAAAEAERQNFITAALQNPRVQRQMEEAGYDYKNPNDITLFFDGVGPEDLVTKLPKYMGKDEAAKNDAQLRAEIELGTTDLRRQEDRRDIFSDSQANAQARLQNAGTTGRANAEEETAELVASLASGLPQARGEAAAIERASQVSTEVELSLPELEARIKGRIAEAVGSGTEAGTIEARQRLANKYISEQVQYNDGLTSASIGEVSGVTRNGHAGDLGFHHLHIGDLPEVVDHSPVTDTSGPIDSLQIAGFNFAPTNWIFSEEGENAASKRTLDMFTRNAASVVVNNVKSQKDWEASYKLLQTGGISLSDPGAVAAVRGIRDGLNESLRQHIMSYQSGGLGDKEQENNIAMIDMTKRVLRQAESFLAMELLANTTVTIPNEGAAAVGTLNLPQVYEVRKSFNDGLIQLNPREVAAVDLRLRQLTMRRRYEQSTRSQ